VTTAVIIHPLALMRSGIARALLDAGVGVGAEAEIVDDGIDRAFDVGAGLIVVGDGVADDVLEIIRNDFPAEATVVLLRQASRDDLVAMVDAGVGGIARRLIAPGALTELTRRVCNGEQVVETDLLPLIFGPPPASPYPGPPEPEPPAPAAARDLRPDPGVTEPRRPALRGRPPGRQPPSPPPNRSDGAGAAPPPRPSLP